MVPSTRVLDCPFDVMATPYWGCGECAVRYRTSDSLRFRYNGSKAGGDS
jgi:hypothetical protein